MLTEVEKLLEAAVADGSECDLRPVPDAEVRAEVVRDLLLAGSGGRGVRLRGARITGTLDVEGQRTGELRLLDCELAERAWLRGASLPVVVMHNCRLTGVALVEATVDRVVLLSRSRSVGKITMDGAKVGASCSLAAAHLRSAQGPAFVADRIRLSGELILDDLDAAGTGDRGAVTLIGARVDGRISARRLRVANPAGPALATDNLQVSDTFDLSQGSALTGAGPRGAVRLVGTRAASVSLGGAALTNPSGWALAAHYLNLVGTLYLDGVEATGGLRLSGGTIGGQVNLTGARVDGGDGPAVAGTRLHVGQAVVLDDAVLTSSGDRPTVDLRSARIAGDLELRETRVSHPAGIALRLNTATVEGEARLEGTVIEQGGLELDGLTYRGLPGRQVTARQRLDWLDRMPEYAAQPYRQLAAAYQAGGHEDEARQVLVAQQDRLHERLAGWDRARHRLFGLTLQYGYQPLRAVALLAGVLLAATLLFGVLTGGTRTEAGGRCAVVDRVGLAIDAAIPLVSTGAGDRCKLATGTGAGQGLAAAGWVLTLVGWASATLVVAGYSGLVRRR